MDALPPGIRSGAVAIGNFDGVHLGHARIMRRLLEKAQAVAGPAVAFTFDPHPVRLLRPEAAPPPLTWTERKAELLAELGVDWIVAYPTDPQLLELAPETFFHRIVRDMLDAKALVEGPNFYFGHDRTGDVHLLRELCDRHGMSLDVVEPIRIDGELVSSSRVRKCIAAGDVDPARRMLTQPYRIRGMVTHGAGRGGQIGFPTANLEAIDTLLPAAGVYAGRALVDRRAYPAAVNLGPNPTFGEHAPKVEVHLIDFHEPLYGQPLEVEFVARLRDVVSFGSVDQLRQQLASDVALARAKLAETTAKGATDEAGGGEST